ncbi:MAG: SDR family oxidoreductase [Verrucomicrobia bacterium]|nr:SDR family oxidoreductase [Verrucomicrobiota bacterium]MBV9643731.1 SDR family oxidoreductase [Verrucomicrobiota bacterium]
MKLPEDFQFDFNQKRILVTGAGKGIGREIASMLHRFNAQVVALSRTEKDLQSLKEEIGCETIIADLGDPAAAQRAAEKAGKIDHLVNNAAIAILQPFLQTTVEAWDNTMAVNLRAVMIVSRVVAKQMVERGVAGSIVNVSSMASFQALHDHAAYCASKAGLDQLTAVMAVELGQHRIRVNSVNPTVVLTEMGKRAWSDPAKGGPMLARIPLRRFAECEEVASVVCFLLTDGAAMLNGLALRIDGGFLVS